MPPWKPTKNHETTLKTMETNQKPWKTMIPPWKTMETNQKPWKTRGHHQRGVTTDLQDTAWESDDFSSPTRGHNWLAWESDDFLSPTRGHNWPFRCLDKMNQRWSDITKRAYIFRTKSCFFSMPSWDWWMIWPERDLIWAGRLRCCREFV